VQRISVAQEEGLLNYKADDLRFAAQSNLQCHEQIGHATTNEEPKNNMT
jgi:hypothetical protein